VFSKNFTVACRKSSFHAAKICFLSQYCKSFSFAFFFYRRKIFYVFATHVQFDAILTGFRTFQTETDAILTGFRTFQTETDAILTGFQRFQTETDAILTGFQRFQTETDAIRPDSEDFRLKRTPSGRIASGARKIMPDQGISGVFLYRYKSSNSSLIL
jgi:hypothetical protein